MNLYVMNKNLIVVGIIDNFSSCIWTNRYYKSGDFELYVTYTKENKEMLLHDNFIYRDVDFIDDKIKSPKIIEKVELVENANENLIRISGRDATALFDRRVIYPTEILKGKIETCICSLINKNIINPTNIKRKINNIITNNTGLIDITIDTQITGDTLLKYIEDICNDYKIGFEMDFSISEKKFIFYLYTGTERTTGNAIIISREFDNLIKYDYIDDKEKYKNMAIIAGAGEGANRKVVYIGEENEGFDRRELWVDAKDLQTTDSEGKPISDADYLEQLKQRGSEKLSDSAAKITNSAEAELTTSFIYNKDYFLGDVIICKGYNTLNERIVETTESDTNAGVKNELTFEEVIDD